MDYAQKAFMQRLGILYDDTPRLGINYEDTPRQRGTSRPSRNRTTTTTPRRRNRRRATRPAGSPENLTRTEANLLIAFATVAVMLAATAFWLAMDARTMIIVNGWG